MKLKDLLKTLPLCTLVEITYNRKGKPNIVEMAVTEDVRFRNQYIVEEVRPFQSILKIKVRERRKR